MKISDTLCIIPTLIKIMETRQRESIGERQSQLIFLLKEFQNLCFNLAIFKEIYNSSEREWEREGGYTTTE